jgi:hypothetical protein
MDIFMAILGFYGICLLMLVLVLWFVCVCACPYAHVEVGCISVVLGILVVSNFEAK